MKQEDMFYICKTIGNLSGIPIRIFDGEKCIFYHSLVNLPKDPMYIYQDSIWEIDTHVGYFATPFFHYYGIVNSGVYKIIIGPSRQVDSTDQELRTVAFQADVPSDMVDEFLSSMKCIVRMPLSSILEMLCTLNFVLNQEKLGLEDIIIYESEQQFLRESLIRDMMKKPMDDESANIQTDIYTSFSVEQQLVDMIRKGQMEALRDWVSSAPAIRAGIMSADQLRQIKNVFIVSATLASRAAIQGGLDTKTSFSLSDAYIQRMELLHHPDQILNLQYHMMMDYTQRVERVRVGKHPSQLSILVANYVQSHLSEVITVEDLCTALYISRSRLTARFKEETGMTLTEFIAKEKMQEAKRLLRYTEKSLGAISNYLGFSSQSHFARVFKKYTGKTPIDYRASSNQAVSL